MAWSAGSGDAAIQETSVVEPRQAQDAQDWPAGSAWKAAGVAEQEFPVGLYVVATPVGNAADLSLRALWVLRLADCVAAEDTRTTAPLLARFGIVQQLLALHQHNEAQRLGAILERLHQGQRVALVSDAGTPAICDPGALLVRAALAAGIRVIPVPGASSLSAALSVAGIRSADIRFAGFAPPRPAARRRHWCELAASGAAIVIFEAPHRMVAVASELAQALEPQRRIVLARELTKRFESVIATTAAALPACIAGAPPRGEYVIVVDARDDQVRDTAEVAQLDAVSARWLAALATELPPARAAAVAARASGLPRALLYRALRQLDAAPQSDPAGA